MLRAVVNLAFSSLNCWLSWRKARQEQVRSCNVQCVVAFSEPPKPQTLNPERTVTSRACSRSTSCVFGSKEGGGGGRGYLKGVFKKYLQRAPPLCYPVPLAATAAGKGDGGGVKNGGTCQATEPQAKGNGANNGSSNLSTVSGASWAPLKGKLL